MAGIELVDDRILVETTIFNFRHLPEGSGLTEAMDAEVYALLANKAITLRSGTIVDSQCHDHLRAIVHEEQGHAARPRDVVHEEG